MVVGEDPRGCGLPVAGAASSLGSGSLDGRQEPQGLTGGDAVQYCWGLRTAIL